MVRPIKTSSPVTADNLDAVLAASSPTMWSSPRARAIAATAFKARPRSRCPDGKRGNCVTWDEVALDKVKVSGEVLVVDELADVAAPLTAVKLAKLGAKVRLLTKWPMIGWETAAEVYLHWILTYLYEAEVEIITDHAVKSINGAEVEIANIYQPSRTRPVSADAIVMATARSSENALYHLLRQRGVSVEAIGCAVAPRTVYEATLEGHRAARKLGAAQWERSAHAALQTQMSA